jgi:hypothetical protein
MPLTGNVPIAFMVGGNRTLVYFNAGTSSFQFYNISNIFSSEIIYFMQHIRGTDYVYVCGGTSGIFINFRNPNDYMIANLYNDVD